MSLNEKLEIIGRKKNLLKRAQVPKE